MKNIISSFAAIIATFSSINMNAQQSQQYVPSLNVSDAVSGQLDEVSNFQEVHVTTYSNLSPKTTATFSSINDKVKTGNFDIQKSISIPFSNETPVSRLYIGYSPFMKKDKNLSDEK